MILGNDAFFGGLVRRMADTSSTKTLKFANSERAKIAVREVLDSAKYNVNIFWKNMSDPILNNEPFTECVKEALMRGVDFKVISQQNNKYPTETQIYLHSCEMPMNVITRIKPIDYNFVTCDNTAYIFWSKLEKEGQVCFNNQSIATKLQNTMDVVLTKYLAQHPSF
jgi:hypothetical protein